VRGLLAIASGLIACVVVIAGWILLLAGIGSDYFIITFPAALAVAVFAGISLAMAAYSRLCRG
jgi:hypothetical protein